jgi:hypothetical protein
MADPPAGVMRDHPDSAVAIAALEDAEVLVLPAPPGLLSDEDRQALLGQRQGSSRFHKNISFRPRTGAVRGLADADARVAMAGIMGRWSAHALETLARLAPRYAQTWELDYASYRPIEESGRELPLLRRNDLLHVDAFLTRPTRGGRILRFFLNVSPAQPRIWRTGPPFHQLAPGQAAPAGLMRYRSRPARAWHAATRVLARSLPALAERRRSAYDRCMLRLHDHLKRDQAFQAAGGKEWSFAPGACWVVFSDAVPHAVLSGCHALEQTVIVPVAAMARPERAPIRVLEALLGTRLD